MEAAVRNESEGCGLHRAGHRVRRRAGPVQEMNPGDIKTELENAGVLP